MLTKGQLPMLERSVEWDPRDYLAGSIAQVKLIEGFYIHLMEQSHRHTIYTFGNFSCNMTNHLCTKQLACDQVASEANKEIVDTIQVGFCRTYFVNILYGMYLCRKCYYHFSIKHSTSRLFSISISHIS